MEKTQNSNEFSNFLNRQHTHQNTQNNSLQSTNQRNSLTSRHNFINKINMILKRVFLVAKKQMIKGRKLMSFMFSTTLFLILPFYVEYQNNMLYEYVRKNGGLRRDM